MAYTRTYDSARQGKGALFLAVGAAAAVISAGILFYSRDTGAASESYKFLIRGDVMEVDRAGKTVKVYTRSASSAAADELGGQTVEFNADGAAFYHYNNKLQKVRTTIGAVHQGDEIVMEGNKRKEGHFQATKVTKNYHKVNFRGILQGHDTQHHKLEIDVDKIVRVADGKSYKPTIFEKGSRIDVYYDNDSTRFENINGVQIEIDDLANSNEKVTVKGIDVQYSSKFVAGPDATVVDGKYSF